MLKNINNGHRTWNCIEHLLKGQIGSESWYKYNQLEILKTCRLFKFAIAFVKIYNILPAIICLFIIVKGFCSFTPAQERKPFVASALIY